MRTKEFFMRLSFLIPMAFLGIFIILILLGIIANSFGAESTFYCGLYCKVGVTLFSIAFFSIIYCQVNSCRKLK